MQLSKFLTIFYHIINTIITFSYQRINVTAHKQHREIIKVSDGVATSHVSSQKQF